MTALDDRVLVDVDNDGKPDVVTPGNGSIWHQPGTGATPTEGTPGTDLVERPAADVVDPVETETALVPVDPPERPMDVWTLAITRLDAKRRPVLPPWVTNRDDLAMITRWAAGYVGYQCAFHSWRLPLVYAPRVVVRAPWGAIRGVKGTVAWIYDFEARPLLNAAVRRQDAAEWERITARMDRHQKARWTVTAVATAAFLGGAVAMTVLLPALAAALAAGGTVALARLGSPKDKPIVTHTVSNATTQLKLSPDMVVMALGRLNNSLINAAIKEGSYKWFPEPIVRDGPGWRATVDLPHGVTALDILEKKTELASALRKPEGAVWPEGDPEEHPGRLVLWVGDRSMSKTRQPAWPLLRSGRADIFAGMPFGFDQRLRLVVLDLIYNNVLIGAIPGHGKTVAARDLVLGCALDPTAEIHYHELKGTGDGRCFEKLAHRYSSGPGDPETLDRTMASIREVHGYLADRALTIAGLPLEMCKDSKVTRALADKRQLRLHPVLLAIDEVQELFESEHRVEAIKLLKAIIKRGRALGIILLLSTQKPDKDALPTTISANMGLRMCGRVMDHASNDQILGTGAHKGGIRGTVLTKADKGVFLIRDGGEHQVVRSADVNGAAAEKVSDRAFVMRTDLGLITGQAAGEGPAETVEPAQILRDFLKVWPVAHWVEGTRDRALCEDLADALYDLAPSRYPDWDQMEPKQKSDAVTRAAKLAGCESKQMQRTRSNGETVNRKGFYRQWVEESLAKVKPDWDDEEEMEAA